MGSGLCIQVLQLDWSDVEDVLPLGPNMVDCIVATGTVNICSPVARHPYVLRLCHT